MALKSTNFTASQFAGFSPEVQAALKANDTGQNNVIEGGRIVQRDPNFTYGTSAPTTTYNPTTGTGGLQMPSGYAASSPIPSIGLSYEALKASQLANPPTYGEQGQLLTGEGAISPSTKLVSTSESERAKKAADALKKKEDEAKLLADQQMEIEKLTGQKTVAELKASLGISEAPKPVSLVSIYETLRSTAGLPAIESQLNILNQTIRDTEASLRQGLYTEEGKLRPMELIGTRQRELARQGQEQLDQLNRDKQTLVDEYTTKTNLISNIMNLTSQDYTNATNAYNTQFTQAVQLQDLINADRTFEQNQANAAQDTAIANLTVLQNVVKDSGKTWAELDPALRTQITNLELKAGLPVGITELLANAVKTTGGKVLTTTSRQEASGKTYYDTLIQNPDGSMQVITTYKGMERLPEGAGGGLTTFKFSTDDKGRLLAVGVSNDDITQIQKLLNEGNTIDDIDDIGELNDEQMKVLKNTLGGITPTQQATEEKKAEKFLSPEWFWQNFTREQLEKLAKESGYTTGGFLGIGKKGDPDKYLEETMKVIEMYRQAGMSDAEILKQMQKG